MKPYGMSRVLDIPRPDRADLTNRGCMIKPAAKARVRRAQRRRARREGKASA